MDNHNPYEKQILDVIICIHNSRDHYKRCAEESEIALTKMSIKLGDNEKEIAELKAEIERLRTEVKDSRLLNTGLKNAIDEHLRIAKAIRRWEE